MKMKLSKGLRIAAAWMILGAIVACGGSDDDDAPPVAPTPTQPATPTPPPTQPATGAQPGSATPNVSLTPGFMPDPQTAQDFVARAVDAFGKVDVMVSNAGICPFHAFLDMPVDVVERTFKVNLHGAYFMVQAAAQQMVKQGHGGSIVADENPRALLHGVGGTIAQDLVAVPRAQADRLAERAR